MKTNILSEPCTECGAAIGASCLADAAEDNFLEAERLDKLYYYAISCALSALVRHAELHGRGLYFFADGTLIIATPLLA